MHDEARRDRRVRTHTVDLPPSQIERIRLAPGVRAPLERRRSARCGCLAGAA